MSKEHAPTGRIQLRQRNLLDSWIQLLSWQLGNSLECIRSSLPRFNPGKLELLRESWIWAANTFEFLRESWVWVGRSWNSWGEMKHLAQLSTQQGRIPQGKLELSWGKLEFPPKTVPNWEKVEFLKGNSTSCTTSNSEIRIPEGKVAFDLEKVAILERKLDLSLESLEPILENKQVANLSARELEFQREGLIWCWKG